MPLSNTFNASLGSTSFTMKDATDLAVLNKVVADEMFWLAKDKAALAAFIMYMSNKNGIRSMKTHRPISLIGDEQPSSDVLSTTFNHGSATYIPLTNQTFRAGNYVVIRQEVSSGIYSEGMYKLTAAYSGSGGYTFATVSYRNTNVAGDVVTTTAVTFTTAAEVSVVASAVTIDGGAPDPQAIMPKGIKNNMQRIRESASVGTHTIADSYIFDSGIDVQMMNMYYTLMTRINNQLYFSHSAVDSASSTANTGIMGGLPYFLSPNRATATLDSALVSGATVSTQGKNYVQAGTAIDTELFTQWAIDLTQYGKKEKHFFGNPFFIKKIFNAFRVGGTAFDSAKYVLPQSQQIWESPAVDVGGALVYLHADNDLRNKKMWMQTSSNNYGYSSAVATDDPTLSWGVCIDPTTIEVVYHDAPEDGGVQSIAQHEVDMPYRNSNKVKEWDCTLSLVCRSPEANGFYALKG